MGMNDLYGILPVDSVYNVQLILEDLLNYRWLEFGREGRNADWSLMYRCHTAGKDQRYLKGAYMKFKSYSTSEYFPMHT